jgi:hypothetical protein
MRLLKAQSTNLKNIKGNGIRYDVNEQVIMDSTNTMLIPKGSTAQRPVVPENGHLRFNTDDGQFEAYQDNAWRELSYKEPFRDPGIVQQYVGDGDVAGKTVFGPLDSQDADYPTPATSRNIFVYVENVYQIPGPLQDGSLVDIFNYTLEESTVGVPLSDPTNAGYAAGWYIVFASPPADGKPVIVTHNFDK